ncbi:MAG: hypothetical protein ACSHXI_04555 [Hoeflea sp.]|uniref:hypothetical protein n=1 Tax=Hoeflea sp. TaxID=1940281 RepID=UPI003EF11E48
MYLNLLAGDLLAGQFCFWLFEAFRIDSGGQFAACWSKKCQISDAYFGESCFIETATRFTTSGDFALLHTRD